MKKITALFTVLLMLVASSAFAVIVPSFPAYFNGSLGTPHMKENGTYLHYTGFALNASRGFDSQFAVFFNNRTSDEMLVNATSKTFNGTYHLSNGSYLTTGSFVNGSSAANTGTSFDFDAEFGAVTGLTSWGLSNSSINATTFFVPAGNYQLMVGFANASLNMTAPAAALYRGHMNRGANGGRAISMPIVYSNGTFNGIASTSDTWDYYAYGVTNHNYPVFVIGQVQITAATGTNNAKAKYYVVNGTDNTNYTSDWVAYNATGINDNNDLALTNQDADYRTLISNATINADQNMITGYVDSGLGTGTRVFVVMIKNGTTLSTSDLSNRAFRQIYVGAGKDAKNLGNSTAGIMNFVYNNDLSIRDGNAEIVTASTVPNHTDRNANALDNYTTALANTSQFGLTQSNMTITAADGSTKVATFIGKQSADKVFTVGIYEAINGDGKTSYRGLGFLIPSSAVTSDVRAAGAGYQANGTLAAALNRFANNATGYTSAALKARWTGIDSNFTPLTDVKGYTVTLDSGSRGDVYFTSQYQITGIGGKISNLRLYKVSPHSTSSWKLGYASDATPSNDGSWWISSNTAGGYLNSDSILDPDTEYYVNWVIKDNGSYDANNTLALGIVDPVVLGSVPSSSSSSSSGCVFNPAAGFGLEWLLLMLAPMIAIVRSRFK